MGKGKRLRGGDGRRHRSQRTTDAPPLRHVAGMALDEPVPSEHDRGALAARQLDWTTHAMLFLLNYMAEVDDQSAPGPSAAFAPRGADETTDAYDMRRNAGRKLKEVTALAGSWQKLCAEELTYIRPSDAAAVTLHIIGEGYDWARATGYVPTANSFRDGATPLLRTLCPPAYLHKALDVLTVFFGEMVAGAEPSIARTATMYPIETVHVAAAMTASLYATPACVPDRPNTTLKFLERAQRYADPGGTLSRPRMP